MVLANCQASATWLVAFLLTALGNLGMPQPIGGAQCGMLRLRWPAEPIAQPLTMYPFEELSHRNEDLRDWHYKESTIFQHAVANGL